MELIVYWFKYKARIRTLSQTMLKLQSLQNMSKKQINKDKMTQWTLNHLAFYRMLLYFVLSRDLPCKSLMTGINCTTCKWEIKMPNKRTNSPQCDPDSRCQTQDLLVRGWAKYYNINWENLTEDMYSKSSLHIQHLSQENENHSPLISKSKANRSQWIHTQRAEIIWTFQKYFLAVILPSR